MLDILDASSLSSNSAALTAFGRDRDNKAAERAEAIRLGRAAANDPRLEAKVRGVAEDFVAVFMNQVMKSMRDTVHENPAMHGDNGEKFFQELLDAEQSKALSKGSGYGLTDLIYESMMASYRVRPQQPEAEPGPAPDAASGAEEAFEVAAIGGAE